MKAAYYPKVIDKKPSVLILGSFATIHNGHKKLIEIAKKINKHVAIMIIEDETKLPNKPKASFAPLEIRAQQLANLGVDKLSVVKFTNHIRLMDGKEFVEKIVKATNAKSLVIGEDFACGQGREYNAKKIAKDFKAQIVPHEKFNNIKISSGIIKEMVIAGEVDAVKSLSPFPFTIDTRVSNKMSYKFNNIKPQPGIYIISAIVNDVKYWGWSHISLTGENKVNLMELKVKNSGFNAMISFHKMSRIIISSNKDKIEKADTDRIKKYFSV